MPGVNREALLRRIFAAADANKDGALSLHEFAQLASSQSAASMSMQEAVFSMLDLNSDGFLSADEFVSFNVASGAHLSDAEFSEQANQWLVLARSRKEAPAVDNVSPLFTMLKKRYGKSDQSLLSLEECASAAEMLELDEDQLKRLLSDRSGGVSESEFRTALHKAVSFQKLRREEPQDVQEAARRALVQLRGPYREPVLQGRRMARPVFSGYMTDALMTAIRAMDVELCKDIIEANADPAFQDSAGDTPLHLACLYDLRDIALMLVAAGADLGVRNVDGHTPLQVAGVMLESKILKQVRAMNEPPRV